MSVSPLIPPFGVMLHCAQQQWAPVCAAVTLCSTLPHPLPTHGTPHTRHYHPHDMAMTPRVVTLWYRAPELLLGATTYTGVGWGACGGLSGVHALWVGCVLVGSFGQAPSQRLEQ
jgi:hypothetical protein